MTIMRSKTADIEFQIQSILGGGPITLDALIPQLAWVDDRRWVGIAVNPHLVKDGKVRYVNRGPDHLHSGGCVLKAVR